MSSTRRGRSLAELMSPIEDDPDGPAVLAPAPRPEPAPQMVVPLNILIAPEDRRRLRQLSLDANLSLQKLGHEAWNLLLQKRGLPPLLPVSANVPSGRAAQKKSRR